MFLFSFSVGWRLKGIWFSTFSSHFSLRFPIPFRGNTMWTLSHREFPPPTVNHVKKIMVFPRGWSRHPALFLFHVQSAIIPEFTIFPWVNFLLNCCRWTLYSIMIIGNTFLQGRVSLRNSQYSELAISRNVRIIALSVWLQGDPSLLTCFRNYHNNP